jgi:hypothetical protein
MITHAETDPLLPNAPGWAGAGLLGLVLAWVFLKYIPQRDRNARYVVDALLAELRAQREADRYTVERLCDEFRRTLEQRGPPDVP